MRKWVTAVYLRSSGRSAGQRSAHSLRTRIWAMQSVIAPCHALGLSGDGGSGSVELAMIRSDNAPGSFTVTRAALVV